MNIDVNEIVQKHIRNMFYNLPITVVPDEPVKPLTPHQKLLHAIQNPESVDQ